MYTYSIMGKETGQVENQTPVFINLLAIARYDHTPDYPIQFMTVGKLDYANPEEALLQYVESQQDEETGEILQSDISLSLRDGRITMERKGEFANTMVLPKGSVLKGSIIHLTVKWIWLYSPRRQSADSAVRKEISI